MTRKRYDPNAITNQYFSLLDGTRAQVRVCRHYGRVMLVGVRFWKKSSGGLGWERFPKHGGQRWKQLLDIANA